MWIKSVHLTSFRNYREAEVSLDPGVNLFLGRNAQGKTNLLEAMYVASAGRSYRAARDAELVRWGDTCFRVACSVQRKPASVTLEVAYSLAGQKLVRLNASERIRAADLSSYLNVVMFTPDDLALVKGSPADRRRFLDLEISQVSPNYRHWLASYSKALLQRNALLKRATSSTRTADVLDPWDEQLVEFGSKIAARRAAVLDTLGVLGRITHRRITGTQETLSIRYSPSVPLTEGSKAEQIAQAFREKLEKLRRAELIRGMTLAGPHRDDVSFEIDGVDAAAYGSQGQQRSIVLSLKLAEVEFIKSQMGEHPVLLLDDVLSELDESRRGHLLSEVVGRYQALVTSSEPESVRAMPPDSRRFNIASGSVTEVAS
ncbi:MAG: DNA replication/repair protein RecF [Firmicutes bacterium]|nr:DNA replication/repair protein RecF [Bacillota bacterium]